MKAHERIACRGYFRTNEPGPNLLGARAGAGVRCFPDTGARSDVDLVSEGLVETVRNKGYRVTEMSDKDLDDVTDLRLLIEPAACRRAVAAATAEDVAQLRGWPTASSTAAGAAT